MDKNLSDTGWRIKNIPYAKTRLSHNTALSSIIKLVGFVLFAGALYMLLTNRLDEKVIFSAAIGIALLILGGVSAAKNKFKDYERVQAEVKDYEISSHPHKGRWRFRLLCEFYYNGSKYTVTPETSHIYIDEQPLRDLLQQNTTHILWVNPTNPNETYFNDRPKIQ